MHNSICIYEIKLKLGYKRLNSKRLEKILEFSGIDGILGFGYDLVLILL